MSNYKLINGNLYREDELLHGKRIRYIDLDTNELVHWKYIKRETLPNGKYRYYYDESELEKYKQAVEDSRLISVKAAAGVVNAESDLQYTSHKLFDNPSPTSKDSEDYKKAVKTYFKAQKHSEWADELAQRAIKEYRTKKISSFAARTISKGIAVVMNWFSSLW